MQVIIAALALGLSAIGLCLTIILAWPRLKEFLLRTFGYRLIRISKSSNDRKLAITATVRTKGDGFPLKLWFDITNTERDPVAMESLSFDLGSTLKLASNATRIPGTTNGYQPRYFICTVCDRENNWEDVRKDRCILNPGETTTAYVPIDPAIGEASLTNAINNKVAGVWHYRCHWLDKRATTGEYDDKF